MIPPQSIQHHRTQFLENIAHLHKSFYRYDLAAIQKTIKEISDLHSELFFCRYAMKANSNYEILQLINNWWIGIDACSEDEVYHAREVWFSPDRIQISSQQSPRDRKKLYHQGVNCVATSLSQLKDFCSAVPWWTLWIRINPWQWSGQFAQINTWGITSSFGIRHEYIHDALAIARQANVNITKLHTHIWSWSDLTTWIDTFHYCLQLIEHFPKVTVLNMWWGYKVARMPEETGVDLIALLGRILPQLTDYNKKNDRHIHLEIEPGSYLVAEYGYIITQADDIVDTWSQGYTFVKTTTGLDMFLRPALYHAQHPLYHYSLKQKKRSTKGNHTYCFVGHCCESSDLLTPTPDGKIWTRCFNQPIERGDLIVIWWCGAYCESMRCLWYNGFG